MSAYITSSSPLRISFPFLLFIPRRATRAPAAVRSACVFERAMGPFHLNATRKTRTPRAPVRFGRYRLHGRDRARDDALPSGPLRFPDRTPRVIVWKSFPLICKLVTRIFIGDSARNDFFVNSCGHLVWKIIGALKATVIFLSAFPCRFPLFTASQWKEINIKVKKLLKNL